MKIGILKYPGGHGDIELKYILEKYFHVESIEIWSTLEMEADIDLLLVPGGFPCWDSSIGSPCFQDSPALDFLRKLAAEGKYIIGFGSGFRMLCELGLLPGKLELNNSQTFLCRHVFVKSDEKQTFLTSNLHDDYVFRLPISTLYGKYTAKEDVLIDMRQDGQILFRYCDFTGRISEAVNNTGSIDNIAAICNHEKNVFGMIPLPERAVTEFYGEADGRKILAGILKNLN